MEQQQRWDKLSEVFSFFAEIGRMILEALILVAVNKLLVRWFSITVTQGLVVLLVLYFFAQVRHLFAQIQVYQNLRDFLDRVGDGPGIWDEYDDDFEDEDDEEDPQAPRRHLTPVYPFAERRKPNNHDGEKK
jgi:hypothetical protein